MREPSSVNSRAVENDVLLRYTFVNELALVNTLTVCIRVTLPWTITLKPSSDFLCAPPCVHSAHRDKSMCSARVSEQRRNISQCSVNRLPFTTERVGRTGYIAIIQINLHPYVFIYITLFVMYANKIRISVNVCLAT